MRLNSGTSQEEIAAALKREAALTWGEERLPALLREIDAAAKNLWTLLQVPLEPMDQAPEMSSGGTGHATS